jgi:hypothetical protein
MSADGGHELFRNRIVSFTLAHPGWTVRLTERDPEDREITEPETHVVIGWALVELRYAGGEHGTVVEPVFLNDGLTISLSEYRRLHDDARVSAELIGPGE